MSLFRSEVLEIQIVQRSAAELLKHVVDNVMDSSKVLLCKVELKLVPTDVRWDIAPPMPYNALTPCSSGKLPKMS